jgi:hypothetical protein
MFDRDVRRTSGCFERVAIRPLGDILCEDDGSTELCAGVDGDCM